MNPDAARITWLADFVYLRVRSLARLSQLEGVAARETALDGHRDQKVCTTNAIFSSRCRSFPQKPARGRRSVRRVRSTWCPLAALIRRWKFKIITATDCTLFCHVVKRLGLYSYGVVCQGP